MAATIRGATQTPSFAKVETIAANWIADYRSQAGIVVEDGPYGSTIEIEDSSRVDPWIVRQADREAAACRERLAAFSRLDRATGEG